MYFEVRETQSGLGTSRTGYPVGTGYQSDRLPSRDWVPVGPVTQSGLGTSRTGYPVTQSGTGTGASLVMNIHKYMTMNEKNKLRIMVKSL